MSAELKNCPFCGGEAKLIEGEECAYVQCLQVKCHRGPFVDGDNAAADEAVEHWNRRTDLSQAAIAAEVVQSEMMRNAVIDLCKDKMQEAKTHGYTHIYDFYYSLCKDVKAISVIKGK